MSTVIADISMSLDGYVTGPGAGKDSGLGQGGEAIQEWVFNAKDSPPDRQFLDEASPGTGAVIMGRNTFDFVDGPNGWNTEISYGYDQGPPELPPVFVVTHSTPESPRQAFTFITDYATHLTYRIGVE